MERSKVNIHRNLMSLKDIHFSSLMQFFFTIYRFKCSECPDYDLCFDCITMSNLLHNVQHHFLKILNPLDPKEVPKSISAVASVNISPILPDTKEKLLALLREEERRRFSPEIQKKYYDVGSDPTCGKDWMDVTDQMQHELVGYSDEAVQLLRRAPQLYPGKGSTFIFLSHN